MIFPLLYHIHYSHHLEDLTFWLDLAKQQGDPILELGCGTGRVLISLVKGGHRAFGLDKDFTMLSLLRHNLTIECGDESLNQALIFQADLSSFNLAARFPLILVPCNTWSTLEPAVRLRSLQQVSAHLSPGGLFVASIPNPVMLLDLPASSDAEVEEIFEHPLSGNPVQVSSSWKREEEHFTVSWYYDHLLPDGNIERLKVDASHHLNSAQGYLHELQAAGLNIDATWGDFDRTEYAFDSQFLILAARSR